MTTKRDRKVPQLRFQGFVEEWEQKTLGELGSVAMNKRIFKHQTSPTGEIPFYKIGTFGGKPDSFISRELFEDYRRRYPYPEAGDLLISAAGSIGRIVEFKGEEEYFQDSNIVWLKKEKSLLGLENSFLKQFYTFVKWSGLEGSTIKRLYNKDILETEIELPSPTEQTQIGSYFKELDGLIDLHQRKRDKLVTLKQAMLRKMFPQDGATTPEIRFQGFEGEWEKATLGQYASFSKGQGYSKSDLKEAGTPIVLYGRLYTRYQTEISNVETFVSEINGSVKSIGREVVVPASGETSEDIARASAIMESGVILGGDLNIIYPADDLNPSFLAITLTYCSSQRELAKKAQGKSVVHLKKADLESTDIPFPTRAEQEKIGSYFRNLDVLISQHSTQLIKLKQIKSACLERMFV